MYKRIDLTKTEGFPFTQDTFDFMQQSYRDSVAAMAGMIGNLVIVTGVADLGASWGDGWVVIDGELLPFVGGVKAARVIVEEVTADETFADATVKTVYYTRRARLSGAGGNLFTDFVRLAELQTILADSGWLNSGIVLGSGWSNLSFQYRRIGRRIRLAGTLTNPSNVNTGVVVLTMPSGFRPARNEYHVCGSQNYLAGPLYLVHIDLGGDVRIYQPGVLSGFLQNHAPLSGAMGTASVTLDGVEFDLA